MKKSKDEVKALVNTLSGYNDRGEEVPDPRPVAVPVEFKRPKSLQERIREALRSRELARAVDDAGMDTFDEAEDFGPEDDFDPLGVPTPYEEGFEGLPEGLAARDAEIKHGAVLDRTPEQKEKARETLRKAEERARKLRERSRESERYYDRRITESDGNVEQTRVASGKTKRRRPEFEESMDEEI